MSCNCLSIIACKKVGPTGDVSELVRGEFDHKVEKSLNTECWRNLKNHRTVVLTFLQLAAAGLDIITEILSAICNRLQTFFTYNLK